MTTDSIDTGNLFENPPEFIVGDDDILDVTITVDYGVLYLDGRTINTRLLNGIAPGPTLRVKAGTYMKVLFVNDLVAQNTSVHEHNAYQSPDTSNLHFHGPFISGELPSDDVTQGISPGDSYQYLTTFPEEHMPGTFWIHPHYHGSTTIQVSGGAAATLIVDDPEGYLSDQVANATEYRKVLLK